MEEYKGFDLGGWIVSILFFIATCNTSEAVSIIEPETSSTTLNFREPKNEGEDANYESINTKLTLVLLSNEKIYAYEGFDVSKGAYYAVNLISPVISKAKNKFGSEFVVLIKPTLKANYKATVDALDEMTLNKVDRFAIVKLNAQEKQLLDAVEPF